MKNDIRFHEIDAIKGLAIVGVIFAHMSFTSRLDSRTTELIEILQFEFGWCVIAFFFCAGALSRPVNSARAIGGILISRAKRLLLPCLAFTIFYKLILHIISLLHLFAWNYPLPSSPSELLYFVFEPIGPQFYFLPYLFCVCMTVATLHLVIGPKILLLILGIAFPIIYSVIAPPLIGYGPEYRLLPAYLYSYVIGCAVSMDKSKALSQGWTIFIFFSLFGTSFYLRNSLGLYIALPFLLFFLFKNSKISKSSRCWQRLGGYSSAIYVWHAPIVLPFMSILYTRILGGGLAVIFPIITSTIVICIFLRHLAQKYAIASFLRF